MDIKVIRDLTSDRDSLRNLLQQENSFHPSCKVISRDMEPQHSSNRTFPMGVYENGKYVIKEVPSALYEST